MVKNVYYLIKKAPDNDGFINSLSNNLINYCKAKYTGDNLNLSLYAWHTLLSLTNLKFDDVEFLENGKPIVKGYAISISHSKNAVFIAYSKDVSNIGIDIEFIDENKNVEIFKSLSKEFLGASHQTFYNKWTEREAYIKTLNTKAFRLEDYKFKGLTKIIELGGLKYSASIHANKDVNFKEVYYEDNF